MISPRTINRTQGNLVVTDPDILKLQIFLTRNRLFSLMKPRLFDFPEWFPHESGPLKRFNNVRIRGDRALEAWNKTKITMVNDAFSHRYLFNKFLLEPYVNATSNARTLGTKILKQSMLENLRKVALKAACWLVYFQ